MKITRMRVVFRRIAAFFGFASKPTRRDPPHTYAQRGTLPDYYFGDRCLVCKTRDEERRAYNDIPCAPRTPYVELA